MSFNPETVSTSQMSLVQNFIEKFETGRGKTTF